MNTLDLSLRQRNNANGKPEICLVFNGNLDNSTAPLLELKLKPLLAANPADLIFDLVGLKYLTSVGIRLFLMAQKHQKLNGGRFCFVNLQPQIEEVFKIMGSLPNVQIFASNDELDEYLLVRQRLHEDA